MACVVSPMAGVNTVSRVVTAILSRSSGAEGVYVGTVSVIVSVGMSNVRSSRCHSCCDGCTCR